MLKMRVASYGRMRNINSFNARAVRGGATTSKAPKLPRRPHAHLIGNPPLSTACRIQVEHMLTPHVSHCTRVSRCHKSSCSNNKPAKPHSTTTSNTWTPPGSPFTTTALIVAAVTCHTNVRRSPHTRDRHMQHVDALMRRCDAHSASKLHAHCCSKRRSILLTFILPLKNNFFLSVLARPHLFYFVYCYFYK